MQDIQKRTNPLPHKHRSASRTPALVTMLLLFSSVIGLTGCQSASSFMFAPSTPNTKWLLWGLIALSAAAFLLGLEQEQDSLSISGLLLLLVTAGWFGLRILPHTLRHQTWWSTSFQILLILGFLFLAFLFLMRSLEDGSYAAGWTGFAIVFFLSLPYTPAQSDQTTPQITLTQPIQQACFPHGAQRDPDNPKHQRCIAIATLTSQLSYRLRHKAYPTQQNYRQELKEQWPRVSKQFQELPPNKRDIKNFSQTLFLYPWKQMSRLALYIHQLQEFQQKANQAIERGRFHTWEIAQLIRHKQRMRQQQAERFQQTQQRLRQLLDAPLLYTHDKTGLQHVQKQLLQRLQRSLPSTKTQPPTKK